MGPGSRRGQRLDRALLGFNLQEPFEGSLARFTLIHSYMVKPPLGDRDQNTKKEKVM